MKKIEQKSLGLGGQKNERKKWINCSCLDEQKRVEINN